MLKRLVIIFILSVAFANAEAPQSVILGIYYFTDKLSAFSPTQYYSPDENSYGGTYYVDTSNLVAVEMRPATAKSLAVLVCATITRDKTHPGYDGVANITKVIKKFPSTDVPSEIESLPKGREACGG